MYFKTTKQREKWTPQNCTAGQLAQCKKVTNQCKTYFPCCSEHIQMQEQFPFCYIGIN